MEMEKRVGDSCGGTSPRGGNGIVSLLQLLSKCKTGSLYSLIGRCGGPIKYGA
jgi:hypothetical protein